MTGRAKQFLNVSGALMLSLVGTSPLHGQVSPEQVAAMAAPKTYAETDFITLYPGVWTPREKAQAEQYLADNAAIARRGPIDVGALVSGKLPPDTPGLGLVVHATEEWVRYNNAKYDPESLLRNTAAYARSLGFKDILAYPSFGTNDDVFAVPFPGVGRDKLLVSELNHAISTYRPVYPGDTLYPVVNERTVLDLTPEKGATYRNLVIQTKGSVYNQRGEKVNDVVFRVSESHRQLKPGLEVANPTFRDIWLAPDWLKREPHYYTDADWAKIREIWSKERIRGAQPLFWEDVHVGDQPGWTLDGPIQSSVSPIKPWGMGAGGSRSLKREIMDPATFRQMVRGKKDGIWRMLERKDNIPLTPMIPPMPGAMPPPNSQVDTADIHRDGVQRTPIVNYMGRDFAVRHIQNWMGDNGWIETLKWGIMDPRSFPAFGFNVPSDPFAEHWLDEVPAMRGRYVNSHSLTNDVAIVKSYVTAKYVKDDRHMADIVWWIETIDGAITQEGKASVRLPSRRTPGERVVPVS